MCINIMIEEENHLLTLKILLYNNRFDDSKEENTNNIEMDDPQNNDKNTINKEEIQLEKNVNDNKICCYSSCGYDRDSFLCYEEKIVIEKDIDDIHHNDQEKIKYQNNHNKKIIFFIEKIFYQIDLVERKKVKKDINSYI